VIDTVTLDLAGHLFFIYTLQLRLALDNFDSDTYMRFNNTPAMEED